MGSSPSAEVVAILRPRDGNIDALKEKIFNDPLFKGALEDEILNGQVVMPPNAPYVLVTSDHDPEDWAAVCAAEGTIAISTSLERPARWYRVVDLKEIVEAVTRSWAQMYDCTYEMSIDATYG